MLLVRSLRKWAITKFISFFLVFDLVQPGDLIFGIHSKDAELVQGVEHGDGGHEIVEAQAHEADKVSDQSLEGLRRPGEEVPITPEDRTRQKAKGT